jgi:isochorismate pyruvate lyase
MKSRKDRISAADCRSMDEIRAAIDEIDREMVDLLAERAGYIDRAWRLKQPISEKALVQWRVEDVL